MQHSPFQAMVEAIFRRVYGPPFDPGGLAWKRGDASFLPELPDPDGGCTGLVMVADGVGGLDLCGTGLRYVLGKLGSKFAVSVVPWGHGLGCWHADLTRPSNRDAWAGAIASAAARFREANPGLPIYLVAKSGGSGVVIRALEQMPAGTVERAILIAPAISPRYDLSAALRGVIREIVVFWSPLDVVVLGAGTCLFGTIDRIHGVSAGLVGFRGTRKGRTKPVRESSIVPAAGVPAGEKLRQIRWRPSMMRTGYFGGHLGPDSPAFLKLYVAPLLRTDTAVGR